MFDKVLAMGVEVPMKPKVKDVMDVSNFAANFTTQVLLMCC